MTKASRERRIMIQFHVVLTLLNIHSELIQCIEKVAFVRFGVLESHQDDDVRLDQRLTKLHEFLGKQKCYSQVNRLRSSNLHYLIP